MKFLLNRVKKYCFNIDHKMFVKSNNVLNNREGGDIGMFITLVGP